MEGYAKAGLQHSANSVGMALDSQVQMFEDTVSELFRMGERTKVIADRLFGPVPEPVTSGARPDTPDVGPISVMLGRKQTELNAGLSMLSHQLARIEERFSQLK